jgi:large conductance mechanosensitive channel
VLKDFRDFVLKGDVVALAVAVVIAVAFAAVVTSFVEDLITPLIAAIGGQPDFADLTFTINGSVFRYGQFINAVVAFLIIAAVVFFLVVRPVMKLKARYQDDDSPAPPEYAAVSAADHAALAKALNAKAGDGWRVVSLADGPGGREVTALMVKE